MLLIQLICFSYIFQCNISCNCALAGGKLHLENYVRLNGCLLLINEFHIYTMLLSITVTFIHESSCLIYSIDAGFCRSSFYEFQECTHTIYFIKQLYVPMIFKALKKGIFYSTTGNKYLVNWSFHWCFVEQTLHELINANKSDTRRYDVCDEKHVVV